MTCLDFTEHQRAVFCVFSGQGVSGLRQYLNTQPDFAEYHLHQPTLFALRRALQTNPDAAQGQGQGVNPAIATEIVDIDALDEMDGVEDDDMGDGSEIALDPGNLGANNNQVNGVNSAIPPPPPPPPHPNPNPLFRPTLDAALLQPASDVPLLGTGSPGSSYAPPTQDNHAAEAPTSSTAGPSIAGQGLFTARNGAGPSTASMQGQIEEDEDVQRS